MNKKSVSPLIATVLIIGFTIVLAAMVMTWGQDLFKKTTESTGKTVTNQLICAQEVKISMSGLNCVGTTVNVNNDGSRAIASLIVRGTVVGIVKADDQIKVITAYGAQPVTLEQTYDPGTEVEIIPVVTTDDGDKLECPGSSDKLTCA